MLEAIGAGTSTTSVTSTDFHAYYTTSELCATNVIHTNALCSPPEENNKSSIEPVVVFTQSFATQLYWLSYKAFLNYWRTPSYNLVRFIINTVIALIFASAYSNQDYSTYVGCVSRSAVIYITVLFCGVVGMITVSPGNATTYGYNIYNHKDSVNADISSYFMKIIILMISFF